MYCYKKGLIFLIFIFYFACFSFSQSLLIPFREGNVWGYADTNGVIQIKPAFDKADFFNFSENITEVFKDKKISLIDIHGKILFPFSDSYYQLADNYIVTQNSKRGLYSKQGVQLLPFEYDIFNCACAFEEYRKEINKIIGIKNNEYYLITLNTDAIEKIPKPNDSKISGLVEGVEEPELVEGTLTSIPSPQLQSRDFPKLNGYKDLVHCETIYMDQKPVFYMFCVWKDRKMIGYIGQNGVVFFKD